MITKRASSEHASRSKTVYCWRRPSRLKCPIKLTGCVQISVSKTVHLAWILQPVLSTSKSDLAHSNTWARSSMLHVWPDRVSPPYKVANVFLLMHPHAWCVLSHQWRFCRFMLSCFLASASKAVLSTCHSLTTHSKHAVYNILRSTCEDNVREGVFEQTCTRTTISTHHFASSFPLAAV